MLTLIGLILVLVYVVYTFVQRKWNGTSIPGPVGIPLLGSAFMVNPRIIHMQLYQLARTHGKIFELSFFHKKAVILNDIKLIEKALVRDGEYFSDRPSTFIGDEFHFSISVGARSLNEDYRFARKAFTKGVHLYGSGIQKFEAIVSGELRRLIAEIDGYDGGEFEVTGMIKRSVLNIMSILLIGIEATDEDAKAINDYLAGIQFFLTPFNHVVLSLFPFLKHLPVYKREINKVKESQTKIHEKYFYQTKDRNSTGERDGVVKELLKAREMDGKWSKLTDEMIQAMALGDILVGGNISTASFLPHVILCLVHHPEYQRRLQDELDSVIGINRDPAIGDKHSCVLLEAIFLETARLMFPGALSIPHVCNQDRQFEGYHIKANTQVFANSWYIQHDENIWGDPWNFRPERFIGEDGNILPRDHMLRKNLILFGVGVRRCPGMSIATSRIFLYISYIFQRFTFEAVPGKFRSCDPQDRRLCFEHSANSKALLLQGKETAWTKYMFVKITARYHSLNKYVMYSDLL